MSQQLQNMLDDDDWDTLTESILAGECVVFLGPDCSAKTKVSNDELRTFIRTEVAQKGKVLPRWAAGDHLPLLCEGYESISGKLRALVTRFYNTHAAQAAPAALHRDLAKIPFSLFVTTAHDDLLRKALESARRAPMWATYNFQDNRDKLISPHQDRLGPGPSEAPANPGSRAVEPRRDRPLVYYLCGHPSMPMSLVLTETDLLRFIAGIFSKSPPLPSDLISLCKRSPAKTYLFLGFGMRDWYPRIVLFALGVIDSSTTFSLAFESPQPHAQAIAFYEERRVRFCDCDSDEFASELARRIGQYKIPDERPKVFVSYSHKDGVRVREIVNWLQNTHLLDLYVDWERLKPGNEWNPILENTIRSWATHVILMHSAALTSLDDSYINKEIKMAVDRASSFPNLDSSGVAFLLPVRIDDTALRADIAAKQWFDLRSQRDAELLARYLVQSLAERRAGQ